MGLTKEAQEALNRRGMYAVSKKELEDRSFDSLCSVMFLRRCMECKCFIEFGAMYSVYLGESARPGWTVFYTCQDCVTARDLLMTGDKTFFQIGSLGDRLFDLYDSIASPLVYSVYDEYVLRRKAADPNFVPPVPFRTRITKATKAVANAFASVGVNCEQAVENFRRFVTATKVVVGLENETRQ